MTSITSITSITSKSTAAGFTGLLKHLRDVMSAGFARRELSARLCRDAGLDDQRAGRAGTEQLSREIMRRSF